VQLVALDDLDDDASRINGRPQDVLESHPRTPARPVCVLCG
jgi:hypothetical protein